MKLIMTIASVAILAIACGQRQQKSESTAVHQSEKEQETEAGYLIVPGERVGNFRLDNPDYESVEGYVFEEGENTDATVYVKQNSESGDLLGLLFLDPDNPTIYVYSEEYRTHEGLGAGSTIAELKEAYPLFEIHDLGSDRYLFSPLEVKEHGIKYSLGIDFVIDSKGDRSLGYYDNPDDPGAKDDIKVIEVRLSYPGITVRDGYLIVPGQRVGAFVLNHQYNMQEAYKGGFSLSEEIDEDWGTTIIKLYNRKALSFYDDKKDKRVGFHMSVFTGDFRTAEGLGVGSSLGDLLNVYPKYGITFVINDDTEHFLDTTTFTNVDAMLVELSDKGYNVSDYAFYFRVLDPDGKWTGIDFGLSVQGNFSPDYKNTRIGFVDLSVNGTVSPDRFKAESKVTSVGIEEVND